MCTIDARVSAKADNITITSATGEADLGGMQGRCGTECVRCTALAGTIWIQGGAVLMQSIYLILRANCETRVLGSALLN